MSCTSFQLKSKPHDIENGDISRTKDVFLEYEIDFNGLLLSKELSSGLQLAGFKRPSPIQYKAIPLGRCGFDLIIRAKSGTGKTCVFGVIALEKLLSTSKSIQTLILAPTREIAVQIKDVIAEIGKNIPNLMVKSFIGGLPFAADKSQASQCNIAVGAPGRIRHLIEKGILDVTQVSLLVLDEADKLMDFCFQDDIKTILANLSTSRQIIVSSATFSEGLNEFIKNYMHQPISVTPELNDSPVLLGLKQFAMIVTSHLNAQVQLKYKINSLISILKNISFKQCIIFSNYQSRAESVCNQLISIGWPAKWITGNQDQRDRLETVNCLKEYRCRVLLTTDLTARGIDAENVNLVINLDMPQCGSTYLHRIGRAGRYGTYALSISLISAGKELTQFRSMLGLIGGESMYVLKLPNDIPNEIWDMNEQSFEKIHSLLKTTTTTTTTTTITTTEEIQKNKKKDKEIKSNKNKNIGLEILNESLLLSNTNILSELGKNLLKENITSSSSLLSYNDIKNLWLNFNEEEYQKIKANRITTTTTTTTTTNNNNNIKDNAMISLSNELSTRINDEFNSRIEIPLDIDITQIEECLNALIDCKPLPRRESHIKISPTSSKGSSGKYYSNYQEKRLNKNKLKYANEKRERKMKKKKNFEKNNEIINVDNDDINDNIDTYNYNSFNNNDNNNTDKYYNHYDYNNYYLYDNNTNKVELVNENTNLINETSFNEWYYNYEMYTKINILSHYYWRYMNE